jgi:hypothetical protein
MQNNEWRQQAEHGEHEAGNTISGHLFLLFIEIS